MVQVKKDGPNKVRNICTGINMLSGIEAVMTSWRELHEMANTITAL